jgi:GNAT superfamily N-acetyltransferase
MEKNAPVEVARLQRSQRDEAVELLSRAFHGDPHGIYFAPDPAERMRLRRESFRCIVGHCFAVGEPYGTQGRLSGVALWMPPGAAHISADQEREFGFDRLPEIFGSTAFARSRQLLNLLSVLHERDMHAPHWYLPIIGVDPAFQGKGIGSALMKPILAAADSAQLSCYLDTAQPRNIPFYQSQGFRILVEDVEPLSGLRFWTFQREPKAGRHG